MDAPIIAAVFRIGRPGAFEGLCGSAEAFAMTLTDLYISGRMGNTQSGPEAAAPTRQRMGAAGENPCMQRLAAVSLAALLAGAGSAHGEEPKAGRYQMVAVPASQAQTFPEALLLDTATGQSWMLYHETGRAIQWIPLPFSAGKDRPATPLPPSPDAAGLSR